MTMLRKISRLFVIKTRAEAWLVTYAIAVGAIERGHHYLQMLPGWPGWLLALACSGVVFIAGAKLLDSVKVPAPAVAGGPYSARTARRIPVIRRNRPRPHSMHRASRSQISQRTD